MSWLSFIPVMYLDQNKRQRSARTKLIRWEQGPKGSLLQICFPCLSSSLPQFPFSLSALIPMHRKTTSLLPSGRYYWGYFLFPLGSITFPPELLHLSSSPTLTSLGSGLPVVFPWKMTLHVPPNSYITLVFLVFKIEKHQTRRVSNHSFICRKL